MDSANTRKGFTMVELLAVIGIIAILATVAFVVLDPPELLAQARDAKRVGDLAEINGEILLYQSYRSQVGGSLGSSGTSYLSFGDPAATSTTGDICQGIGMSPTGNYANHCAASSTVYKIDGTGWLPVPLNLIPSGVPFGSLPVDPVNQTSSNLYYTYETNGNQWALSAFFESQKYAKTPATTGGIDPSLYEVGTGIGTLPEAGRGLVGYWPLNEGTGGFAYDWSGSNATGTWYGSMTGGSYYTSGKTSQWAGSFDGATNYVLTPSMMKFQTTNPSFSASMWINLNGLSANGGSAMAFNAASNLGRFLMFNSNVAQFVFKNTSGTPAYGGTASIPTNGWFMLTGVYDGTKISLYVNGVFQNSVSAGGLVPTGGNAYENIGSAGGTYQNFKASIDDVRIYGRALSAAEIQQIYNAEK